MPVKEFRKQVATKAGISQVQAQKFISALIDTIGESMDRKDTVVIPKFASFKSAVQKGKTGRAPKATGTYTTQDKDVVKVKLSRTLRNRLQNPVKHNA